MLQSIFNGLSSLINHQRAMDITSHNISNSEVSGYSKQRVNLENNFTRRDGNHEVGVGVHTHSVTRMHNAMLFDRVLDSTSNNASSNEEFVHLQRVEDALVGDGLDGNTMGELTDKFFNDVQLLASEPDSLFLKANVKISGEELIDRAGRVNTVFNDYKMGLNEEKDLLLQEAQGYMQEIDSLTKGIQEVEAFNQTDTYEKTYANDLRDKRDVLELKLSEIGNFKSTERVIPVDEDKGTVGSIGYSYTFEENGGRLEGLDRSLESINRLQSAFNTTFGPIADKVDEFINGDMSAPNDLLQWNYDNDPAKTINDGFVGFSSEIDSVGNTAGSTEAIMRGLQAQNDKETKVNLDEEMTNMIRYQRAYEAAAKVIQTSDEMLKTLLDMKR